MLLTLNILYISIDDFVAFKFYFSTISDINSKIRLFKEEELFYLVRELLFVDVWAILLPLSS
jgi:hypothetical protein